MKYLCLFLIGFLVMSFNVFDDLNMQIYNYQKQSFPEWADTFETQREFRTACIGEITEFVEEDNDDTLILSESYRVDCDGCPADFITIYSSGRSKEFRLGIAADGTITGYSPGSGARLQNFRETGSKYLHLDIKTIVEGLRDGKKLKRISEKNNTYKCHDGSNTIYTVMYPNKEIECMKIRCWKNW